MEKFFKHPWVIVGVTAAITVFFAAQLPKARMDNNMTAFLPADNPARLASKHLDAQYGEEITIILGLERPYGTVFDSAFLSRLREYTKAAENIELIKEARSIMSTQYITSDSESIIVTELVDDGFSGTPEEIAELKRRIASWDMYQGALVSDDLSSAQVMITINASSDDAGNPEIVALLLRLRDMAKEMFAGYAAVYTAGQPVVSATLSESARIDVRALVPFVILVLIAVLVLSFRRFSYVLYPLLTVLIAAVWAVGAMPLLGIKLTMICVILPVILIAVGSAYAIHLVSHYKDEIQGKTFTAPEHRAFVFSLTGKLLKPVSLAALTTFAGFVSFALTPLIPLRNFGIFASFGVLAAFAVAITFIPALLLIRGPRAVKPVARKKTRGAQAAFDFENEFAAALCAVTNRKTLVLLITALAVAVSIAGASRAVVDGALVEFFNERTEVNRSDRFIRERFGGSTQLILSVEADDTETLLSPETLTALDGLSTYLIERVPRVTKAAGFADTIKRVNQVFNVDEPPGGIAARPQAAYNSDTGDFGFGDFGFEDEGGSLPPASSPLTRSSGTPLNGGAAPVTPPSSAETPITFAMLSAAAGKKANMSANELARELERMTNYEGRAYYEIPADPARYGKTTDAELQQLIANYLVPLAGSDNRMSNDPLEPTAVKTTILINSQWTKDTDEVIRAVNEYVDANFHKAKPGALPNIRVITGGVATQQSAMSNLIFRSQVISLLLSLLIVLIIVAFSYKSLAAGLIAALPLSIAILGNFAVMGFAGLTINVATALTGSLAVGIGIDYTIHIIDAFKREYEAAPGGDYLRRTFAGAGKAILINAVSVGAGFGVLTFSQFRVLSQFGGLITLSMAVSAAVSLTVIPVLLAAVKPKFIYGQGVREGF